MTRRKVNADLSKLLKEVDVITVGKAYTKFLLYCQTRNKTDSTLLNYSNSLRRFFSFLSQAKIKYLEEVKIGIDEITLEVVENYILDMHNRNLKASSINTEITNLNVFCSFLAKQYKVNNPIADIEKIKEEKNEVQFTPTTEQLELAYSGLDLTNFTDFRTYAIMVLIANTGLRVSEVANLTIQDVDLVKRELIVKKAKSRKFRIVPLNDTVTKTLSAWLDVRGELMTDAFFVNVNNSKVGIRNISMFIHNLGKYVGIPKLSPHSIRRYFITELLNNGIPVTAVCRIVGHQSVKTILNYYNLEEKNSRAAVNTIGRKKNRSNHIEGK